MKLDRFLDIVINKFHILLGTAAQGAVFFWQFKGHDIGPGVQNSLYAFFAFLLGHAATYQKWPDADAVPAGKPDAPDQPGK
jgi:hypothetical protein